TTALIQRLEGKPIDIPRIMLASLDIAFIQINTKVGNKRVRRCKQIVEIIDIDHMTKEILTNEVFRWDPTTDKFIYSGKSYILERVRKLYDLSKEEMMKELKRRVTVLNWMRKNNIREFKDVAKVVSLYTEVPDRLMEQINNDKVQLVKKKSEETDEKESVKLDEKRVQVADVKEKNRSFFFKKNENKINFRRDSHSTN
ncbi:MAG: hypothetical protein V3V27_02605, partial [Candidatus Thermoplasmatota archaeon]